jgi:hypothetical protein
MAGELLAKMGKLMGPCQAAKGRFVANPFFPVVLFLPVVAITREDIM